jgi:3'-5' exoribonuclease
MKDQFVAGLTEGSAVDSVFVLRARDLRSARTGDAYLSLEFSDRTGRMPGVLFRPGPEERAMPPGVVARVRGTVTSFRGVRRISVDALRPVADYDRSDLVPSSARSRAELLAALRSLIEGVGDTALRSVLEAVFGDDGFARAFAERPATSEEHHAYAGGLLEHTVAVASLCRVLASRYDGIDGDLLVTGALVHDLGIVEALRCETSVEETDAGRLLGHVALGDSIVAAAIAGAADPPDASRSLALRHLVTSHHADPHGGERVGPCTLEAVALHHADQLDAQAAGFLQAVASAAVLEETWTEAGNRFGRPLSVPRAPARPRGAGRAALGAA